MHLDISCFVPPPQVSEQDEASLQDDHIGHNCVLHGSSLVRMDNPLPN